MKLGTKIRAFFISVGLVATIATGSMAYWIGRESLKEEAFGKLTAIREVKRQQIEDYFRQVSGQIVTLAGNPMLIDAMRELHGAFQTAPEPAEAGTGLTRELLGYYEKDFLPLLAEERTLARDVQTLLPRTGNGIVLQHRYIAANTHPTGAKDALTAGKAADAYDQAHETHHPLLRRYLRQFGYYDLLLVGANGDVVYSVFKEIDYATNLLSGPHRESKLSQAFRKTLESTRDAVTLVDFGRYLPSYGAPAAFNLKSSVDPARRQKSAS